MLFAARDSKNYGKSANIMPELVFTGEENEEMCKVR